MESASGLDVWTFVVALVSALLALLALLVTIWFGRRQIRLAEEQLTLARKEAENRPTLEVSAMNLVDSTHVGVVVETAQERDKWVNKLRRYERAMWEYERRPTNANSGKLIFPQRPPTDPREHRLWQHGFLMEQQDYEGPFPHYVLRVTVVNKGKTAANDVSGQLYFDPNQLEPLDFPGMDGNVEGDRVDLYTNTGSTLLPAPTNEELTFDVALLVKNPGTTSIRYAFATPQGDNVEDTWSLDVPKS